MRYWLLKSEPGCFSIEDLKNSPAATSPWDGVRNYQARNFMKDKMKKGDLAFFYHSGGKPAIVGLAEITSASYADPTQWDPENQHYDPASSPDNPRWYLVDVTLKEIFPSPVTLKELRDRPELDGMELLRRGSRLSVQPVSEKHFAAIMALVRNAAKA